MAKVKADWIKQAKALGLDITEKSTVANIKAAIEAASGKENKPAKREAEVAKAGKRSAKVAKESEAEEVRKEKAAKRKDGEAEEVKPKKGPIPVTRPRIDRRSKKYQTASKKISDKDYGLKDALATVVETSTTKFDSTVELHLRLDVDPKIADQNIRDSIVLPNGTGKSIKVAVFAEADDHEAATKAGADIVGEDDLLENIKAGKIDFDLLIATPKVMAKLGQLAKVLGPKGLMPNPKSGTVTTNVAKAVTEAKAGKIEYRVDTQGIIHTSIGKVSFGADKLLQNAEALLDSVKGNKPASLKNTLIVSVYVTTTMGPSIKINLSTS